MFLSFLLEKDSLKETSLTKNKYFYVFIFLLEKDSFKETSLTKIIFLYNMRGAILEKYKSSSPKNKIFFPNRHTFNFV